MFSIFRSVLYSRTQINFEAGFYYIANTFISLNFRNKYDTKPWGKFNIETKYHSISQGNTNITSFVFLSVLFSAFI